MSELSDPDQQPLVGMWRDATEKANYCVVQRGRYLLVFATTCSALLQPVVGEDGHQWFEGPELHANGRFLRTLRIRMNGTVDTAVRRIFQNGAWSTPSVLRRVGPEEEAQLGKYIKLDTIWKALEKREPLNKCDTRLVKGSWIIQWMKDNECLPKRQELPAQAFWRVPNLKRKVEDRKVFMMALSYAWTEATHPDPDGQQMRTVAEILGKRLAVEYHAAGENVPVYEDAAIFIDWVSLYQGEDADLSPNKVQSRQQGLHDVNIWYAHEQVESWLLTRAADGAMDYEARGWPFWEKGLSCMSKQDHMVFDIGKYDGQNNWTAIYAACKAGRSPPLTPTNFNEQLSQKGFSQQGDEAELQRQYGETFNSVMGAVLELAFSNLDWTDMEAHMLAEIISFCQLLEKLDLKSNEICADGVGAICEAATHTPVEVISLTKNPLFNSGAQAISTTLARMRSLKTLWLNECGIGNAGIQAIMSQVCHSPSLENLYIFDNAITDEGMQAVIDMLPQCPRLLSFGLGGNHFSEGARRRVQRVWQQSRPRGATIYLN